MKNLKINYLNLILSLWLIGAVLLPLIGYSLGYAVNKDLITAAADEDLVKLIPIIGHIDRPYGSYRNEVTGCGGVVIENSSTEAVILTAKHCVTYASTGNTYDVYSSVIVYFPSSPNQAMGIDKLKNNYFFSTVTVSNRIAYASCNIITHPTNDLAIIKLPSLHFLNQNTYHFNLTYFNYVVNADISLLKNAFEADLLYDANVWNHDVVMFGWGPMIGAGIINNIYFPVNDIEDNINGYYHSINFLHRVVDHPINTNTFNEPICKGDSGGPLFVIDGNALKLAGIASHAGINDFDIIPGVCSGKSHGYEIINYQIKNWILNNISGF